MLKTPRTAVCGPVECVAPSGSCNARQTARSVDSLCSDTWLEGVRGGKVIPLKETVDRAVEVLKNDYHSLGVIISACWLADATYKDMPYYYTSACIGI